MVLNRFMDWKHIMRGLLTTSMVFGALMLGSCGSSEETATEEEGFEDAPPVAAQEGQEQQAAEVKKDEGGDQQALTSFIGAAPTKEVKKEEPKPEPVQQAAPVQQANPTGDLQTENTSLKQQVVKLEQDVRSLNARISDTESKYMSEKDRADKAEEAARVAAQSAAISARGAEIKPVEEATDMMGSYASALSNFKWKKYDDAIGTLESMLTGGAPQNLQDNCHYWIGESNFGKKNYREAMKHFEMVLDMKNSEKLADAQYMLAQCLERTGNKSKAKEAYERVVKDFPLSNNVQRAKERWARL